MKAFTIKVGDKLLDYRLGQSVDLQAFSDHLKQKGYEIEKVWNEKRHAVGIIYKSNIKLFVKLATSEGISRLTQNEFEWNEQFNKLNPRGTSNFWVPTNFDIGYFSTKGRSSSGGENLFYLITDYGQGEQISSHQPGSEKYLEQTLGEIIEFAELIQSLNIKDLNPNELFTKVTHRQRFVEKAHQWLEGIPVEIIKKYQVEQLMTAVENGSKQLERKPRHGDFTPWHIFKYEDKLFLYDAEHALSGGVEYYDIAYYIQRVFSILENKTVAEKILNKLRDKKYDFEKLQTVLAARAIGGFLDRSLHEKPNYEKDNEFKEITLSL